MYPTRAQVKTQFLAILDDPLEEVFTDAVFQAAFSEAFDVLYSQFLQQQVPRILLITHPVLPPFTTSITPASIGIADFADYEYVAERTYGSGDQFCNMDPVDRLSQRVPIERLVEFVWRNNTFYFIGATNVIELEIEYDSSGEAPTDDATTIQVDGCRNFLANYSAGKAAPRKGRNEEGQQAMSFAVGPKFDQGTAGGELFRLIAPLVRSRQHVQVAQKPYSAIRRLSRGLAAQPYIGVQQGTTGGGAQNVPVQFSSALGTIVGVIDGVNAIFWLTVGITQATVSWNGLVQTENVNYTRINNQLTFLAGNIPNIGDTITAEAIIAT